MFEPFRIIYDEGVETMTAELYNWTEAGEPLMVLYFHDEADHQRWKSGASFRLINHWVRPAPVPKYK